MRADALRILWVGTKSPWPPIDGGRVLSLETLRAVAEIHEVTLVVPNEAGNSVPSEARAALAGLHAIRFVPVSRRSRVGSILRAAASGRPFSIEHHAWPDVTRVVARLLAEETFDLVHAEQLQAFQQCAPALALGIPIVLREQNVESDLWSGLAEHTSWPTASWLRREARQLERWEGRAVRESSVTVALTSRDAARLATLGNLARVVTIPVPFPSLLPLSGDPLPGSPTLVVFGSANWKPNQDGSLWFLREIWPSIKRRFPEAIVHVYGLPSVPRHAGVVLHASPVSSGDAFSAGSILIVPLRFASGARMRILEGLARGLPVIATSVAMDGMGVADGSQLLIADRPEDFIRAITRLGDEPALAGTLRESGRALLREHHDPARSLSALLEVYASVAQRS